MAEEEVLAALRRGRLPQLQEPEPVDWAMEEASDDEDDAPMPELIDMPPAPASAPRMSNLERCIALRLVATRRSHRPKKKKKNRKMSQMIIVTCGLFSCAVVFVVCPAQDSLVTKKNRFFLRVSGEVMRAMASNGVHTR